MLIEYLHVEAMEAQLPTRVHSIKT